MASMNLIVACGGVAKLRETPELVRYLMKQDSYCNSDDYISRLKTLIEVENHLNII